MSDFQVGDRVTCDRGKGIVRFIGPTEFADGRWVGIELDEKKGKNNGTVKDTVYFECPPEHGVFLRPDLIRKEEPPKPSGLPKPSGMKAPTTSARKSTIPKPSPRGTPKMSPAVSTERLSKVGVSRKPSEAAKMAPLDETITPVAPAEEKFAVPELPRPSIAQQPKQQETPAVEDEAVRAPPNVREQAKKIDQQPGAKIALQRQDSQMTNVSITADDDAIVRGLKEEIADLNSKLDASRAKVRKDAESLAQYDRLKIDYQRLLEFKTSITEEQRLLRRKLEETEARLAESEARADHAEASMSTDLGEQLELVTLDKLMAEERVEILQAENEEQKLKIESLESEMQILHAEMQSATADGNGELVGNTVQFKQLTEQLDQYKEAILKMRDIVNTANAERSAMEKQLEAAKGDVARFQADNDRLQVDLNRARAEISELHEQMDAAMGSARMVDYLTDQNLNLEDQVRTLTEEKEHLEELYQLNEEIVEAARQTQLDIRQECDSYLVSVSEKTKEVAFLEGRIREYDNVVQKFRQKISDLTDEIVEYKDQIQILDHQLADRDADGTLNATAIFTANRNFADRVQSKLNALKVKYLEEQLKYLREFLPDNFFKTFSKTASDNDCILITLFFPRMADKADLLSTLFAERFPDVPDGMHRDHVVKSHKAEQWAHVRKFRYFLSKLTSVMHRFESMIGYCTLESLSRLAISQSESVNREQKLDWYLGELIEKRLDETTSSDPLEQLDQFFRRQLDVNVTAKEYDTRAAMEDCAQQFLDGVEWIRFNCERLRLFLFPQEAEESDFAEFLRQMDAICVEISSTVLRAKKLIPTEKMIDLSADIQTGNGTTTTISELITNGFILLEKIANRIHDTSNFAASQLMTNDVDGFAASEMLGFLQSVVEKKSGSRFAESAMVDTQSALSELAALTSKIAEVLEKHRLEIPLLPVRGGSPLHERAAARKQDVVDAEALRWQISKKDEEIGRMSRALKDQADYVCVLKIDLERTKLKSSEAGRQEAAMPTDKIQELLNEERQKHEKTIAELRSKVEEVERQMKVKENEVERINKTRMAFLENAAPGAGSRTTKTEYHFVNGRLRNSAEVIHALYHVQDRCRRLQAELNARNVLALTPLKLPEKVCGIESMKLLNNHSSVETKRKALLAEADLLQLEYDKLELLKSGKKLDDSLRRQTVEYNKRVDDLWARCQTFRDQHFPDFPFPKNLPVPQTMPEPSEKPEAKSGNGWYEECHAIMNRIKQRRMARQVATAGC
ncbi:Dynactin subunit 1 [Aphelenchoides fujianensis]|nr:Dynactin subunit 1 [Aphelenchoides fujianensis]